MIVKEKLYTINDLWAMGHDPAYENRYFYLIDGMLFEDEMPGRTHGRLAIKLGRYLDEYAEAHNLGEVTSETGYHPAGTDSTLLLPDVAFQRWESVPQPPPEGYVPAMPDLAVEILSPSETYASARRKAEIYLLNGTSLVWLVLPASREVEVCRMAAAGGVDIELVSRDETLSGEDILPGFTLPLRQLFAVLRE